MNKISQDFFFTSESVTEGHPDKLCDQISDSILDACLMQDPLSRVACECAAKNDKVILLGEITSDAKIDFEKIVRDTILDIGYDSLEKSFDGNTCEVEVLISKQSSDIVKGVWKRIESKEIGAGDQGMMFGYACDETDEYLPLPIYLAHKLTKQLSKVRKSGELSWLYPDGKSQVTVEYVDGKASRIDTVLVSTQHSKEVTYNEIRDEIVDKVIKPVLPQDLIDEKTKMLVNPTGRFVIGGPKADAGVTGRKIIVDTYGGMARHGGGAFSGKDCTKVDRSGAYMARYIAKNIVAAGLAKKCEIQVSYGIGLAQPLNVYVETFDTGRISEKKLSNIIQEDFDLRPGSIIEKMNLRQPIYKQVSCYGHFGRDELNLPWERLDMVTKLKKYLTE
jgi:S-adenosylmethionine synthetase